MRRTQIPATMQATYDKAISKASRAMAIKAMCQECVGYEKKAITECSDFGCPLFAFRPYQKAKKRSAEAQG